MILTASFVLECSFALFSWSSVGAMLDDMQDKTGRHLEGLKDIKPIDLSDIPIRVPSRHVYYLYQSTAPDDLEQLINQNKPATKRRIMKQIGDKHWHPQ